MMLFLALLMTTTQIFAADQEFYPVKPGMPSELVCSTFKWQRTCEVDFATRHNAGKLPSSDVMAPVIAIAHNGYPAFVASHPEVIADSHSLIAIVNAHEEKENSLLHCHIVDERLHDASAHAHATQHHNSQHALAAFWLTAQQALMQEVKRSIPALRGQTLDDIILANPESVLNPADQKIWLAFFAATASTMETIRVRDEKAFRKIFNLTD